MWIVFRKSDGKVVGASADSTVDVSREVALREVVEGLVEREDLAGYDAFQVQQQGALFGRSQAISLGHAFARPGKDGELELVDETPETATLVVTTDAQESHPVDGAALIPGDGESFVTLHLAKLSEPGKPLERKRDNDTFWLRTDHGTLRDDSGNKEIRSIKLASGKASFRLYSEKAKRLATVQIFNADPYVRDAAVRVEFT
ncbi:MAG: hypothetical protein QOJ16_1839 [Acidobacteriota bacterium]|jgi:hypothetical protein|nr:hypothetical protein [Acidobacteriota bacterium]